jgi:hypothetical protein
MRRWRIPGLQRIAGFLLARETSSLPQALCIEAEFFEPNLPSRIYRAELIEPNFLSGRRAPCREFHSPQAAGMKTGPVNPARRS